MSFVWPTSHVGMLHPFGLKHARDRWNDFVRLARAGLSGTDYNGAKKLFSVSHQQVETRKSLFEELGLLYVAEGSDQIILTPVGKQLLRAVPQPPPTEPKESLRLWVDEILCWALSNTQINRPQSFGSPKISEEERTSCTIRPYACFWQAMRDLGGSIALSEFVGALRYVKTPADYTPAMSTIKAARAVGRELSGKSTMNYQIYWKSHATLAESILDFNTSTNTFHFKPHRRELVYGVLDFHMSRKHAAAEAIFTATPWSDVQRLLQQAGRKILRQVARKTTGSDRCDEFTAIQSQRSEEGTCENCCSDLGASGPASVSPGYSQCLWIQMRDFGLRR
jgi:hypothetical protein